MRASCEWFAKRASRTWAALAGRSFLVLAPHGCDDELAAQLVAKWCTGNFRCPEPFSRSNLLIINVVSDNLHSSHHFARRVASEVGRQCGHSVDASREDYATDIIQCAIESALASNRYPMLIIERFHAFAQIKDGEMQSVLSQLRTLEMDGKLTTIAFSPMPYDDIRRSMDGSQAFLNSVYGDAHDHVVLDPVTRQEFVDHAVSSGVSASRAHSVYAIGGGPDRIFSALLDALISEETDLVSYCVSRCHQTIGAFFSRTLPGAGGSLGDLLGGLTVGRLRTPEEAYLKANAMRAFFSREGSDGTLRASTPILSRWILANRAGPWSSHGDCLRLLREGDVAAARQLAEGLVVEDPRHCVFPALVILVCALQVDLELPFFGLDWEAIDAACKVVQRCLDQVPPSLKGWVVTISRWSSLIKAHRIGARLQSDKVSLQATDEDQRHLMLFMIAGYLRVACASDDSSHLDGLVKLPEILLQTLSVGYCGINFASTGALPGTYDYQEFFSGTTMFSLPTPGSKLTLASLIVIVPAILKGRALLQGSAITDPKRIRALQGSLVEQIRNRSAHAVVELSASDRSSLEHVCQAWLSDWMTLEGIECESSIPGFTGSPTIENLEELLIYS